MAEPVWYYARGDVEKGPLSTAQINALAAAGKIRRDDYVWKEGMENWIPAGEVSDLFPAEGPAKDRAKASPQEKNRDPQAENRKKTLPGRETPRTSFSLPAEPRELFRLASRLGLLIGILAVTLARGCDSLGERYAARLEAIAALAESRFQSDWESHRQQLESRRNVLQALADPSPADQEEIRGLTRQISELDDTKRTEEGRLRGTQWRDLRTSAELAVESNRVWGFWRELLFQFGTLFLAFGLVGVAYQSEGPERWICLVVLAVIVYSIFGK